jgi:hypothetical protein
MIVDFEKTSKSADFAKLVIDWVVNYFDDSRNIWRSGESSADGRDCSFLPPLYFQHDGHSRTIIGMLFAVDYSFEVQ